MTSLRWLDDANADIETIIDYLETLDIRAAVRIVDEIYDQAGRLADFPHSGRPGRVEGTRELPVLRTPYVLVYTVEVDVLILRVLHGARRWPPTSNEIE